MKSYRLRFLACTDLILIAGVTAVLAQAPARSGQAPQPGQAARGQTARQQDEPFPPHRIADNLYYVGSKSLGSFLITTDEGLILINSSYERTVPLIRASVEKLGYKFT